MVYIVIAPARTYNQVEDCAIFVTDDEQEARKIAVRERDRHEKRGYDSWAKRVRILRPITAKALVEVADRVAYYGHCLDMASNGNSFLAVELIEWANTLMIRADQLANPESYAA